jgi:hypothetical protein
MLPATVSLAPPDDVLLTGQGRAKRVQAPARLTPAGSARPRLIRSLAPGRLLSSSNVVYTSPTRDLPLPHSLGCD